MNNAVLLVISTIIGITFVSVAVAIFGDDDDHEDA